MANFDEAVKVILEHEGGYVNDPNDSGGETNFGISKRSYPDLNIKGLTVEQAKEIYKKDYWDRIRGDSIVSDTIATDILDTAVNMGVVTTAKLLQTCLGVTVDGHIGDKTLQAINSIDEELLLLRFKLIKVARYAHLVKINQKNRKYFYGWVRRTLG